MSKTYFVSGHLDLTALEFLIHYAPRLRTAINEGALFVVGDAKGCDHRVQQFLKAMGGQATIYHMHRTPRNNEGFPTKGGFPNDVARDEAMTAASDDDIAWVRPGREDSGTAKNLARRCTKPERG